MAVDTDGSVCLMAVESHILHLVALREQHQRLLCRACMNRCQRLHSILLGRIDRFCQLAMDLYSLDRDNTHQLPLFVDHGIVTMGRGKVPVLARG